MSDVAGTRRKLNVVLAVGIADALLLLVLVYVAFIDRSDAAVSVLGFYLLAALLMFFAIKRLRADWVDDPTDGAPPDA